MNSERSARQCHPFFVLVAIFILVLGFANEASAYTIPEFFMAPQYPAGSSVTAYYSCRDYFVLGPNFYWLDTAPAINTNGGAVITPLAGFRDFRAPLSTWADFSIQNEQRKFACWGYQIPLGVLNPGRHNIYGLLSQVSGGQSGPGATVQGVPVWGYFSKSFEVCVPNWGKPCQDSCGIPGSYIDCDGSCNRTQQMDITQLIPTVSGPRELLAYDSEPQEYTTNICLGQYRVEYMLYARNTNTNQQGYRHTSVGNAYVERMLYNSQFGWWYPDTTPLESTAGTVRLNLYHPGTYLVHPLAILSFPWGAAGVYINYPPTGLTNEFFSSVTPGEWGTFTVNVRPRVCYAINVCGQTNQGALRDHRKGVGGTCDAVAPPVTTPNGNPYGAACPLTSSGNVCGQTTTANTGTYNCSGDCVGTSPAPPPNSSCNQTLTVNSTGNGTGTVSGSGTYSYGSTATARVSSVATGSTFSLWSGDCSGTASSVNLSMTSNKTCTATFTNDRPSIGTVTINAPGSPPLVNTIRETPFEYTITVSGSDSGGAPKVHALQTLINRDGGNAGQYRGYLAWNEGGTSDWAGNAKPGSTKSCTGVGGTAIVFKDANTNYGHDHLNLVSCSVSDAGNTRTASFVATFNPSYTTPLTGNDISGLVYDDLWQSPTGSWTNFDINFRLVPHIGAECRALTDTCAYIPASSTCTPSATGYTTDTYRWEITRLSGGAGTYDPDGTYDYEWLSTDGPSGSGTVTGSTRSNASRSVSYPSSGSKLASLKVRSAGSPYSTFTCASANVLPIPDLTAGATSFSSSLTDTTVGMAGEPVTFSGAISNTGPKTTGSASNIPSVFEIRKGIRQANTTVIPDTSAGSFLDRKTTNVISSLATDASAAVSASYTFAPSTVATFGELYVARACANMNTSGNPVILEAPGANNCGDWTPFTIRPALAASCSATCPDSQTSGTCYTTSTVNWDLTALSGGQPPYTYSWTGGPADSGTGDNSLSKSGTLPDASAASRSTATVSKRYLVPSPPDKTATITVTSLGVTKSFSCTPRTVKGIADLTAS